MNKYLSLLTTLLFYCFGACQANHSQYQAQQDLEFIHNAILENHPGVYNTYDPQFNQNLQTAYDKASKKIAKTPKLAINEYVKSFNDSHLSVHWKDSTEPSQPVNTAHLTGYELADCIAWITLPTFDLNEVQQGEFELLIQELPHLRQNKYIIFDLRSNQGGNSQYGSRIIEALFGKQYAEYKICQANKHQYVEWRASEGNLQYITQLTQRYPELKGLVQGLRKSIQHGQTYYKLAPEACGTHHPPPTTIPKLIVIIDKNNVSAALDFIDELKAVSPDVILIGQQTKADRLYMEVRTVALPSGKGYFSFPIKVYRNRVRGNNQPYLPDIKRNDLTDTEALQRFVIASIIEK